MIRFILNDTEIATSRPPGTVMLDFVRYHRHLTGTKIGCREGDCGACTVLVGHLHNGQLSYQSMTSCLLPIGNAEGKHIVTIEGINGQGLTPVQEAFCREGATQCGFCTPGFIVSLTGYCLEEKEPDATGACSSMDGNICRCTGYKSIERASAAVADLLQQRKGLPAIDFAIAKGIVPAYFQFIRERLLSIRRALPEAEEEPDQIVGGGTDLYVQKQDEMAGAAIQFVFDRPELNGITLEGEKCRIGPAATISDLLTSPLMLDIFPAFSRYAGLVSSTPIRNMATIAGNFINASPIGDFTIFFLALDAQLILEGPAGKPRRTVALRELYKGYRQLDMRPREKIAQIYFEKPRANAHFNFEKVSKRTHLDIASVNSALLLEMENSVITKAGLSAGGVSPIPLFLGKSSAFLEGKTVSADMVDKLIAIAQTEISPISDARGSKAYKTLLLSQLIRAHFVPLLAKQKTIR